MVVVYQLVASGRTGVLDVANSIYSKNVFFNKENAEDHVQEFFEKCTTPKDKQDFGFLDKKQKIEINIIELEIPDAEE